MVLRRDTQNKILNINSMPNLVLFILSSHSVLQSFHQQEAVTTSEEKTEIQRFSCTKSKIDQVKTSLATNKQKPTGGAHNVRTYHSSAVSIMRTRRQNTLGTQRSKQKMLLVLKVIGY